MNWRSVKSFKIKISFIDRPIMLTESVCLPWSLFFFLIRVEKQNKTPPPKPKQTKTPTPHKKSNFFHQWSRIFSNVTQKKAIDTNASYSGRISAMIFLQAETTYKHKPFASFCHSIQSMMLQSRPVWSYWDGIWGFYVSSVLGFLVLWPVNFSSSD